MLRPAASLVLSESMLAGTSQHDRSSLATTIERLGGYLGVSIDHDRVQLGGTVLASNLEPFLALLAEVLVSATYPNTDVHADRDRIAHEIVMAYSQPEVVAGEALRRRLYAGHPYATGMPAPDSVRRVSSAALRRLHAETLAPELGRLVLVGDLRAKTALGQAAEALGQWLADPRDGGPRDLPGLREPEPGPLIVVDRPGAVQSNLRLARLAPGRTDPVWPASALANLAFGAMSAARLVENLRERHGYTYSPDSAINHARAGSAFVIQAEVATGVTAPALVETLYELGRTAVGGFSSEELESARRYSLGTLAYSLSTQAGTASTLARLALSDLGPGYLTTFAGAISKATKAEVDEAAGRLFAVRGLIGLVVGDAAAITAPLERVTDVKVIEAPAAGRRT
jgi:predicted Zn-dependent peptidase